MKFDSRKNLRNLDEFLVDDTDLSLDEVKAELRAAGADVESFQARIRDTVRGAALTAQQPPLRELPANLDARQAAEMFKAILAGNYGEELQAAALLQAETHPGEPAAEDLRLFLSHASVKPERPWSKYPVKEMIRRGWINHAPQSLQGFFENASLGAPVFCRKTDHIRSSRSVDTYALEAWAARVQQLAPGVKNLGAYRPGSVTPEFMRSLLSLSRTEHGPAAAREFLAKAGIPLVIEPHLSHTHLDGAAILIHENRPIIGLTVRHDRLDNFWFTLMHELAHVHLHSSLHMEFFDDFDEQATEDPREKEADALAGEVLIPQTIWMKSAARLSKLPQAAELLARQLNVHPAIVAGRMRHHWNEFTLLNDQVGHRAVRIEFNEVSWPA